MAGQEKTPLKCIEATFKLVTPAFCAGAHPQGPAEIRLPSILGQLRWWWRALAWPRTAELGDVGQRLKKIHAWEAKLFGSAEGGMGAFTARLSFPTGRPGSRQEDNFKHGYSSALTGQDAGKGLSYSKGLGVTKRYVVPEGSRFSVQIRWSRGTDTTLLIGQSSSGPPTLEDALRAFGMLGGIGARMRRGFGSVALVDSNLDTLKAAADVQSYRNDLKAFIERFQAPISDSLPPLSALGPYFRSEVFSNGNGVPALHDDMGQELQSYRNCRKRPSSSPFVKDHDWFYVVTDNGEASKRMKKLAPPGAGSLFHEDSATLLSELGRQNLPNSPERCIFGLPHNYSRFERDHPQPVVVGTRADYYQFKADIDPAGKAGRRASPLVLHLHQTTNGQALAVWMLFESMFLPEELDGHDLSVVVKRSFIGRKEERQTRGRRQQWIPISGTQNTVTSNQDISLPFLPDYGAAHDFLDKFQ